MARITVIVLVVSLAIAIKCYAQEVAEERASPGNVQEDAVDANGEEEQDPSERRSMAQASASARGYPNGGPGRGPVRPAPVPVRLRQCYTCTNCPEVEVNTSSRICPYDADPNKSRKCVVYKEKYKHMKKPWFVRGCASERGTCEEIRRAHENENSVQLLSCEECEDDKCNTNGVTRSLLDFTTAFLMLVVTPLLTKYTLS